MSPLWRDQVWIYLSPRKIAHARRSRGLRPAVSPGAELAIGGGHDVATVLNRLAEVLSEPMCQDADALVLLADAWVRFGIVPAQTMRLDDDARRAHARYVLADTYGDMVSDWEVALENAPPGRPSVVCAMPGELRAGLEAAFEPARLKLRSVQPHLAAAFNACRHRLPSDDAWFAALSDGWLCAAHLAGGTWDRVHTARLGGGGAALELERLQTLSRLGAWGGRLFVEAPPSMRSSLERLGPGLEWIEAPPGDAGTTYELALMLRAGA